MMKQWWHLLAIASIAVAGSFLMGLRQAKAQSLPPCVTCTCKGVYCWWSPALSSDGRGAKSPGHPTGTSYAQASILCGSGCQTGTPNSSGAGLCDLWDFTSTRYVCTQAGQGTKLNEVSAVDMGSPSLYNQARFTCQ